MNKIESNSNAVKTHYCITWMLFTLVEMFIFWLCQNKNFSMFLLLLLLLFEWNPLLHHVSFVNCKNFPFRKSRPTRGNARNEENYPTKARQYGFDAVNLKPKKKKKCTHSYQCHWRVRLFCCVYRIKSREEKQKRVRASIV